MQSCGSRQGRRNGRSSSSKSSTSPRMTILEVSAPVARNRATSRSAGSSRLSMAHVIGSRVSGSSGNARPVLSCPTTQLAKVVFPPPWRPTSKCSAPTQSQRFQSHNGFDGHFVLVESLSWRWTHDGFCRYRRKKPTVGVPPLSKISVSLSMPSGVSSRRAVALGDRYSIAAATPRNVDGWRCVSSVEFTKLGRRAPWPPAPAAIPRRRFDGKGPSDRLGR